MQFLYIKANESAGLTGIFVNCEDFDPDPTGQQVVNGLVTGGKEVWFGWKDNTYRSSKDIDLSKRVSEMRAEGLVGDGLTPGTHMKLATVKPPRKGSFAYNVKKYGTEEVLKRLIRGDPRPTRPSPPLPTTKQGVVGKDIRCPRCDAVIRV